MSSIRKISLALYLFFLIFAPPIMPEFHIALAGVTILYLIFQSKNKLTKIYRNSGLNIALSGMLVFLVYIIFILIFNEIFYEDTVQIGHYISLYNRFIAVAIVIVPGVLFIIYYLNRYKMELDDLLEVVIMSGAMEALTCLLALLFPSVKTFFNELTLTMGGGNLYENTWYITVRSYGFARTLVDVFGWGTGLIAGISFIYGIFKKKKYIVLSFMLLISPLLNARTGIVIYVMAVIIILCCMLGKLDISKFIILIIAVAAAVSLFGIVLSYISKYYPATGSWIEEGMNSITYALKRNENVSNISGFTLAFQNKEKWDLPKNLRLFWGTGHSRYSAQGYTHTDFGYVNDIWAGGILGIIVLYGSILIIGLRSFKKSDLCIKIIIIYCILSFFVFNIKACSYGYNCGMVVYILVIACINYYNYPLQLVRGYVSKYLINREDMKSKRES